MEESSNFKNPKFDAVMEGVEAKVSLTEKLAIVVRAFREFAQQGEEFWCDDLRVLLVEVYREAPMKPAIGERKQDVLKLVPGAKLCDAEAVDQLFKDIAVPALSRGQLKRDMGVVVSP